MIRIEIKSGFKIASFHFFRIHVPISNARRLKTIPLAAELKIT